MTEPICFRAGGERTKVSEEDANEILQRFQNELDSSDASTHYKLDLSCRAWRRESLEILRPFISGIANRVVILKVDDVIASLETEDGLDSLSFFPEVFAGNRNCIQELDLDDNALGIRAIEILKPLLAGPKLETLKLSNCGLSLAVGQVLHDTLLPVADSLKELDLSRNQIGADGAEHVGRLLSNCPNLECFKYAGSRPLSEGTGLICKGLAAASDLGSQFQYLDLNDCHTTDDEAVQNLCSVLKNSPGLETLILKDCSLDYDGVQAVLTALQESGCNLHDIYLGGNDMDDEDVAQALANYLQELSSRGDDCQLSLLDLECCELGDEGTVQVVEALTSGGLSNKLLQLNLETNEIGTAGARSLLNPVFGAQLKAINLKDNMDIPLQLATRLKKVYGEEKILVDDDLEEDENYQEEEEDHDASVDALQAALEGAHI